MHVSYSESQCCTGKKPTRAEIELKSMEVKIHLVAQKTVVLKIDVRTNRLYFHSRESRVIISCAMGENVQRVYCKLDPENSFLYTPAWNAPAPLIPQDAGIASKEEWKRRIKMHRE